MEEIINFILVAVNLIVAAINLEIYVWGLVEGKRNIINFASAIFSLLVAAAIYQMFNAH